jgi:hypothetical protein
MLKVACQGKRGHDFEMIYHVSLRRLSPPALVALREMRRAELALPELFFDMDLSRPLHAAAALVCADDDCDNRASLDFPSWCVWRTWTNRHRSMQRA